jgi:hypothetical protein
MLKLNRPHGIEIGSKVKVIDSSGSAAYRDFISKIVTVTDVIPHPYVTDGTNDMISCVEVDGSMYAFRFELVAAGFGLDDLQPLQRVVTRCGRSAIVSTSPEHGKIIVYDTNGLYGSFDKAQFNGPANREIDIVAVYGNPSYGATFNQKKRGPLVWEAVDPAVAARAAELAKLQAAADAANKALADFQTK